MWVALGSVRLQAQDTSRVIYIRQMSEWRRDVRLLLCRAVEISRLTKYSQYSPSHLESQAFCPPSSSQLQGAFLSRGSGTEMLVLWHFLWGWVVGCMRKPGVAEGWIPNMCTSFHCVCWELWRCCFPSGRCENTRNQLLFWVRQLWDGKSCFHKILWNWLLTSAVWPRKLSPHTSSHLLLLTVEQAC